MIISFDEHAKKRQQVESQRLIDQAVAEGEAMELCRPVLSHAVWPPADLAEFYRILGCLQRAGFDVEFDHGATDEGDLWAVFEHRRTGQSALNVSLIDETYFVFNAVTEQSFQGESLQAVTRSIFVQNSAMPAASSGVGDALEAAMAGKNKKKKNNVVMLPSAGIIAMTAAALLLLDLVVTSDVEAADMIADLDLDDWNLADGDDLVDFLPSQDEVGFAPAPVDQAPALDAIHVVEIDDKTAPEDFKAAEGLAANRYYGQSLAKLNNLLSDIGMSGIAVSVAVMASWIAIDANWAMIADAGVESLADGREKAREDQAVDAGDEAQQDDQTAVQLASAQVQADTDGAAQPGALDEGAVALIKEGVDAGLEAFQPASVKVEALDPALKAAQSEGDTPVTEEELASLESVDVQSAPAVKKPVEAKKAEVREVIDNPQQVIEAEAPVVISIAQRPTTPDADPVFQNAFSVVDLKKISVFAVSSQTMDEIAAGDTELADAISKMEVEAISTDIVANDNVSLGSTTTGVVEPQKTATLTSNLFYTKRGAESSFSFTSSNEERDVLVFFGGTAIVENFEAGVDIIFFVDEEPVYESVEVVDRDLHLQIDQHNKIVLSDFYGIDQIA